MNIDYSHISLLADNGRSKVFKARRTDGKPVLLKTCESSGTEKILLRREYETSLGLTHPNVAYVIDFIEDSPLGSCIVMEYVDGCTLDVFLSSNPPIKTRTAIFSQILEVVGYIHEKGIVHNDLRPQNILVTNPGNKVKLIDFGLSDDYSHFLSEVNKGTWGYSAPELFSTGTSSIRSDIWSLGALMKDIFGSRFGRIRKKCCHYVPSHRYDSISALRKDWDKRNPSKAIAYVFFASCIAFAIFTGIFKSRPNDRPEPDNSDLSVKVRDSINFASHTDTIYVMMQQQEAPPAVRETPPPVREAPSPVETVPSSSKKTMPVQDLSAGGTANCYIVPSGGSFKFPAKCKGCKNLPLDGIPFRAEVLWEAYCADLDIVPGDIVHSVELKDGFVFFEATGHQGNAVIAVMDSLSTILWSWHIWSSPGFNPDKTAITLSSDRDVVMDRNLGATSSNPSDPEFFGLMYQWGRKDPFRNIGDIPKSTRMYSTAKWPANVTVCDSVCNTKYLQTHPMTFLIPSKKEWYRFYAAGASWGSEKTEYDPCPAGWKVPDGGEDGLFGRSLVRAYADQSTVISQWDQSTNCIDLQQMYGADAHFWLPAAGIISSQKKYLNNYFGEKVYLWTADRAFASGREDRAYIFTVQNSNGRLSVNHYTVPSFGLPVRCCRDIKPL